MLASLSRLIENPAANTATDLTIWALRINRPSAAKYFGPIASMESTLELTHKNRAQFPGKEHSEEKAILPEVQRRAVERMEICEDVGELARELGVRPRCLYKWRRKLEMVEPGQESSRSSTHASAQRKEIHRLKQLLAEKTLEVDFFKGALQKSGLDASAAATLAKWHLRPDPRSDVIAR
jgi:transposase-like protein